LTVLIETGSSDSSHTPVQGRLFSSKPLKPHFIDRFDQKRQHFKQKRHLPSRAETPVKPVGTRELMSEKERKTSAKRWILLTFM